MTSTAPAAARAADGASAPRTLAEATALTRSPDFAGNGDGRFGDFGGAILPPPLVGPMAEVAAAYEQARHDEEFYAEYSRLLRDYVGRPSPIVWLILWAPVWLRSSRLSRIRAPPSWSESRSALVIGEGRPTTSRSRREYSAKNSSSCRASS